MQLPSDQDASGRTLGDEELGQLAEVIRSGVLTETKGTKVKAFASSFAEMIGSTYATACSSGTAACHLGVVAVEPEPGDEIITTSITDMGALAPILFQGAIPVFADVDPLTVNVTADTIAAQISDRTKGIVVTHLFGNPCDMDPIMALAESHGIPVIEDCAQAYGAKVDGRPVGTIGAVGCFSLQQGKHITTGEGGVVVSDDEHMARLVRLWHDKAWGYGDPNPDHYFLALNYRMTELVGAVALAQLGKLPWVVERRVAMAERLTKQLADVPGIQTPVVRDGHTHTYWKYPLMVDPEVVPGGSPALGVALKDYSVASAPRYIQKPAFRCQVFTDQNTLGSSHFPFNLARPEALDWSTERYPGTFEALERILVLPWNERYEDAHVDYLAESIAGAVASLTGGAS